ncbi:MAG: 16S rRNA (adenine(1518)-N(6)/adenine(1519)-N(6))-dimethyltransferase RsmA [Oscillospiraceae bacterium]|nr:16S rRNA (adenine(1518)-N(6)/adenine(1519)-N(6))-dimethyltransferase RsmA [Oscillospiraceae bacterium]
MTRRLTDLKTIQAALAASDFRFSKRAGQNFLINPEIPGCMAALFDKGQAVLEIGPGFGALTHALCQSAGFVVAVESDFRLLPLLKENLRDCTNLNLIQGDALKLNLEELFPNEKYLSRAICSNLPYSITSPLLTLILEHSSANPAVLMVQKEVAYRICALPGTPEYGALTLFCLMYASCEILYTVTSENFVPRPKVDSAVIRLKRHTTPLVPEGYFDLTKGLIRAAFAQRRKTLANALSCGLAKSKEEVRDGIKNAGIDPAVRGEALALEDYVRLAKIFS